MEVAIALPVVSQRRTARKDTTIRSLLSQRKSVIPAIIILASFLAIPNVRGNANIIAQRSWSSTTAFAGRQIVKRASYHQTASSRSSVPLALLRSNHCIISAEKLTRSNRIFSSTTSEADTAMNSNDKRAGPPLVDVDCNLLHPDLISLLSPPTDDSEEKNTKGYADNEEDDIEPELKILHHLSTMKSNVAAMISPSSTLDESERSIQVLTGALSGDDNGAFSKQTNGIVLRTTVGVHPYHAEECGAPFDDDDDDEKKNSGVERLRALLENTLYRSVVSCIGETGLDYSDGFPDRSFQIPWFKAQLDLAFEYGLPVFVHERLAFEDTLHCIDDAADRHPGKTIPKIIVHCFTGNQAECEEYVKRGYYLSVSGYIIKAGEGNEEVRRCLSDGTIPLEKFMIETDAPYMGFNGCRTSFYDEESELLASLNGKKRKRLLKGIYPNVPSSLPLVLQASLDAINEGRSERGEDLLSLDDLARISTQNAVEFFSLPETVLDDVKSKE